VDVLTSAAERLPGDQCDEGEVIMTVVASCLIGAQSCAPGDTVVYRQRTGDVRLILRRGTAPEVSELVAWGLLTVRAGDAALLPPVPDPPAPPDRRSAPSPHPLRLIR
jgi:hypothetical protein